MAYRYGNRRQNMLLPADIEEYVPREAPLLVKLREDAADKRELRAKVQDILEQLDAAEDKKSINTTDPDCTRIHGRQVSHARYNAQAVVDEKHGLIASSDVVNGNNGLHQFARQTEKAVETLGKKPDAVCADAGFSDTQEMEKIDSQGIKLVVPSRKRPINNPGRLINVISRSITMLGRQGIPGDYGVVEEGTLIPAETMTATT